MVSRHVHIGIDGNSNDANTVFLLILPIHLYKCNGGSIADTFSWPINTADTFVSEVSKWVSACLVEPNTLAFMCNKSLYSQLLTNFTIYSRPSYQ